MPAPGDQHHSWANPFEEPKQKVSLWTAQEIATIASKLDKQLGPEYISNRSGPGGQRVHYLTAEKCITLANEVFGFNGWSSSIQNIQVDFADENPQTQRVSIGLSVIVRVTLRDGTFHEDIGYGSIENAKGKAMAFEKAKKEGTTDGLKRALRSFGNILGNCIYDKDYVSQVVKLKAQPVKKFDQNNLHRHADFIVKKEEPKEQPAANPVSVPAAAPKPDPSESFEDFLGELDEADFCVPEDGHPDEIILSGPANGQDSQTKPPPNAPSHVYQPNGVGSVGPNGRQPQTPNQPQPQKPGSYGGNGGPVQQQYRRQPAPPSRPHPNAQPPGPSAAPAPQAGAMPETVGFFSAKAVSQLPESSFAGDGNAQPVAPRGQLVFNPKAESPSIRKTPGIDHSSSKPVARNGQHVAPITSSQAQTAEISGAAQAPPTNGFTRSSNTSSFTPVRPSVGGGRGGMANPALEQTRRIGAPNGPGSPLGNRGSFRQPTMKRPPPGDGNGGRSNSPRPALADVPTNVNANPNMSAADGIEAKRQKMA